MIGARLRAPPAAVSHDPRIAGRVRRLSLVSAVALGIVWWLELITLDAPWTIDVALATGWLVMPPILLASLRVPRLRYALVIPSSLVGGALIVALAVWPPADPATLTGWRLVILGIVAGGGLGVWFWYRLLPVPPLLDAPNSSARWTLIAAHVLLILAGVGLIVSSLP